MRPKRHEAGSAGYAPTVATRDLKVARTWALKERFCQFWEHTYLGAAQRFFGRWFGERPIAG
jgi:hypothetical protein